MEKTEKLTFSEWIENLWYRYNWMIIILGLIAVFAVIALVQMLSIDDPDVSLLYVGPEYLTQSNRERVKGSFAALADDFDGDGKITADILDITLKRYYDVSDAAEYGIYDQNNEALKRFQIEIRSGDAVIYLLDETFFEDCLELGILASFDSIFGEGNAPKGSIGGFGIRLGDIDAGTLPGFDALPRDMVLCLRRAPSEDAISYGRDGAFWENNRKAFVNLAEYRR